MGGFCRDEPCRPPAHCEQGARRPAGTARPCLGDQSDCARGMTVPDKVNLAAAFATFHDHWNPRVAGDINNFQVKLAKFAGKFDWHHHEQEDRSEEHTSELQSLMRISYAVFCLKKKIHTASIYIETAKF